METRPGVPKNGGNGLVFDRPWSKWDLVHQEGSGITQNGGSGLLLDLLQLKRGLVDREGCGIPQNGGNRLLFNLLRSKRGSCSSGGVWHTTKRDSTGYCSSPPSTSSSLHGLPSTSSSLHRLLFIQPPPRATPPATVQPPLSTGSCSTTPPRATVHPPLHRLLFIQPSM